MCQMSCSYLSPRHHNKISSVQGSRLGNLNQLETLDLSNNDIMDVREHCFPRGLSVRELWVTRPALLFFSSSAYCEFVIVIYFYLFYPTWNFIFADTTTLGRLSVRDVWIVVLW